MNILIITFIICITIYAVFAWILPWLFALLFKRKYHITVRVGRIALPLSLKDIVISKNGFCVNIDEISIRSSFFNSDVTKLLSIIIRDVRIKKDIGEVRRPQSSGSKSSLVKRISRSNSWHNETSNDRSYDEYTSFAQNKVLDFREIKVPRSIITFAQFMAVHVYNISVVLLRSKTPGWLLHASAGDLHLDGSIVNSARSLLVNVTLGEAEAKILHHTPRDLLDSQPCLGELSFAISLEAMLIAQGPLSVEKLNVTMKHTKVTVHEGLYGFLIENKNLEKPEKEKKFEPIPRKDDDCDYLLKLLPIIPKKFDMQIDDTTLTGMRDNSRKEFSALLQCMKLNTWFTPSLIPDFTPPSVALAQMYCGIEEFEIHSLQERLLLLRKFSVDAKLEDNNMVNLSVKLHTLHLYYNHRHIHSWISTNFLQNKPSGVMKLTTFSKDYYNNLRRTNSYNNPAEQSKELNFVNNTNSLVQDKELNWLEALLSRFVINCSIMELWNVCAMIKMYDQSISVGFSHTKLILDQLQETRDVKQTNKILHTILGQRHWSTELLLESLWARVSSTSHDLLQMKKYHVWGTTVYLGMALVKLCSHGKKGSKMEAMFDTIRTEWSPQLSSALIQVARCIEEYKPDSKRTTPAKIKRSSGTRTSTQNLLLNVSLTNVNTFFITENSVCLMARLESLIIDNSLNKSGIIINGLKFCSILDEMVKNFICPRADEIDEFFSYIKIARIDLKQTSKSSELSIQLLEEIHMNWSANLHLHFITLERDLKRFRNDVKSKRVQIDDNELAELSSEDEKLVEDKTKWTVSVCVKGDVSLEIYISEQHQMNICADEINVTFGEDLRILVSCIIIYIDGADIFTIQGLQMQRLLNHDKVLQERAVNEEFILPKNKVWGVTIPSLRIVFPYEHQYAHAIHDEFVSLFKWLKIVHGRQKKSFTLDSPLPSDLVITVKEFLFEMSDDPFEVKLRDNYELLEDEYKESLKRQKMLDAKVAELCKTHPLLAAGKVEELYTNLSKKNAEIYVQRSRLISNSGPARTRLFAWCLNDLEILALADPSIHGTDNCTRVMRNIDPDSPWPEEGIEFTTLWCRSVVVSCVEWKFLLRDYPQPMLDIRNLSLFGLLVGAEQEAPRRAKRDVVIDLGDPFGHHTVQRGMTSLKFYHDFNCEVDRWSYAFGPCWEPVMAQCNLSFEKISSPSRDPSPTLPFWDKMRLLFHGRFTMWVRQLTVLLHASLDPYNTTEEMELSWSDVAMDWTNAKIVFKGHFNVYVRTASKYDDCQLMKIPNLKLTIKLQWICLANPNDHHSVIPCAPDKVPEYSINQEHDSFRAFRSQNVNINISFETKDIMPKNDGDYPMLVLFGSTLRWFESLKLILSGVTRPTRRGTVFKNVRPRRAQLSRHYKTAHLIFSLHKFQVCYWMSFAKQRGFQLDGQKISSSSEHNLTLHPINDGLRHRPRAEWSIMYMTSQLDKTDVWLKSALQEDITDIRESMDNQPVEKCFCLSVDSVSYGRAPVRGRHDGNEGDRDINTPTHQLVVRDLKGAWTKSNRDVAFALFDTFMKNKQLKKNLSTEALKGFRAENNSNTPLKSRRPNEVPPTPATATTLQVTQSASQATPSPLSKVQSGHAAAMLQQLIAEAENKAVVFSDDLSAQMKDQQLQGLQACQNDDIVHNNWLIALVNSQVLLKGCETQGYIILSAAKAEIFQRIHQPVWRDRSLVPKTTWVGSLECMQYYATVSAGESDSLYEKIMWLEKENIEEKDSTVISELPDVPDLVGSGQSVGGVVSQTVGASGGGLSETIQLQRIVSRCKCEFFYVGYGDTSIDPANLQEVPPLPQEEGGPWEKKEQAVDAFTLMHHDLDVCTNSLQYAMILDVVNNLLLYVEPQRKQALERLARMRFQLQLHRVEDQRRPIQHLQNQVRSLVSKLRRLEKDTYLVHRALQEVPDDEELIEEIKNLETQVYECKEQLTAHSEELDMMLSCYKETQISATNKMATMKTDKPVATVRANEICFKHAQWRLTDADGQLGIADLVLSNFLYTKNSKSNDSVEHLLELGYVRMTNLLPNEIYSEVLCPTEIQSHMPVDRKRVLRVFCRERPPVGGISVKEHFEINVVPITIGLTKKFYNTMLKFCFPERDPDQIDGDTSEEMYDTQSLSSTGGGFSNRSVSSTSSASSASTSKKSRGKKSSKDTNFYIKIDQKDDVEKMKERAEKNKLFIYIKIPEVPVRVSYKGNKEKNIEDIKNFSLVIPTLEYHNVTWTWLDLLLAMKSDSRRVILSQAIKQKLQIHRNKGSTDEGASPQEEDKAKMLFGSRRMLSADSKNPRKGVFKSSK